MTVDVVAGQHRLLAFALKNDVDDVGVVVNPVVGRWVGAPAQCPRRRFFHDVSPLPCAEAILTANDHDEAIVGDVGTDDVLAHGERDGLRFNVPADIDAASRGASRLGLHGLDRARFAGAADGHFPCPVRMDLGIGTGQHFRAAVGSLTLVDINLDDLVAEPVG